MYCSKHPKTETNLRCGKCDEPVCTSCMVHGPVGVRCQECGRSTKLPTFQVSGAYMARAIAAGIVLGIGGGVVAGFLSLVFRVFLLDLVAIVGVGYLIAVGISASVNHKRGRGLKIVAAGSMFMAFFVITVFAGATLTLYGLIASFAAFYVAISHF